MTFCCGFKYLDSVYLFCDSAITENAERPTALAKTSFGVSTIKKKNLTVYEGANKIRKISDSCFVAVAGDVFRALDIVDSIGFLHSKNCDIKEIMEKVSSGLCAKEKENENNLVGLIIAAQSKDGSELFYWDSKTRKTKAIEDFCGMGSLPDEHKSTMQRHQYDLANQLNLSRKSMLTSMAAFLQTLGMHEKFLDMGVGGVINGVEVGISSANWLDDTSYVICNEDGGFEEAVLVLNRDGATATRSTYTGKHLFLITEDIKKLTDEWKERWLEELDGILWSMSASTWVFIEPQKEIIIIVECQESTSKTPVSDLIACGNEISWDFDPCMSRVLKNSRPRSFFIHPDYFVESEMAKRDLDIMIEMYERGQAVMGKQFDQP